MICDQHLSHSMLTLDNFCRNTVILRPMVATTNSKIRRANNAFINFIRVKKKALVGVR